MTKKRGSYMYVPAPLCSEIKEIKTNEHIFSNAEAMRKLTYYSRQFRLFKKAVFREVFFLMVAVFAIAIGFLITHFVIDNMRTGFIGVGEINQSTPTMDALAAVAEVESRMDYVFFFIAVGMSLAILILSWMIAGNPLFFIFDLMMIVVGVIIAAVFSNAWYAFIEKTVFAAQKAAFPLTNYLLTNLPGWMIVVGIFGMILTFSKPGLNGGNI